MIQQSLNTLRYFLLSYLVVFIMAFALFINYSKADLFLFVNSRHNPFLDTFFSIATYVGDGFSFEIVLIIVYFIISRKKLFLGITIFAISSLVSTLFKRVLFNNELRPSAWFPDSKIIHFVEGVTVYAQNSFPSGHTITAFALAFYATYLCKNKWLGILFLLLAILVGYSRIYLGQHFFADVMFGSLLSVITSIICIYVFERYVFTDKPRKLNPTEADTGLVAQGLVVYE